MAIGESELILNEDGSIYHLNLLPEDIASTIITVGDPERVSDVSKYFDDTEVKKEKREFHTHTGILNGKRLTVISTGIGTDNIDIVLNELDALVNIDFDTRTIKSNKTVLDFVRIGTSGAIQSDIEVDSFLLSETAIGFDGLLHFYDSEPIQNTALRNSFTQHLDRHLENTPPYVVDYDKSLGEKLVSNRIRFGTTVTNAGFYGPQGRRLRLRPYFEAFNDLLTKFRFEDRKITNLEMETAGIYGLARLLGHRAVSTNVILANRATGHFSKTPRKTVDALIQYCLEKLT